MTDRLATLLAVDRPEPPEPSLLGWLAGHCARADLPAVLRLAKDAGGMEPPTAWPVILDAVREQWTARGAGQDASARAGPPASLQEGLDRLELHHQNLDEMTDQEVTYLLPLLPGSRAGDAGWRSAAAVEDAVRADAGWYAAALTARAGPYLEEEQRARIAALGRRLSAPWPDTLLRLARVRMPWSSAAAELEASHPSFPEADDLAARLGAAAAEDLCHRVISRLTADLEARTPARPPVSAPWPPSGEEDADRTQPPFSGEDSTGEGPPPRTLGGVTSGRVRLRVSTGLATTARPREPVPSWQCLEPGTDYLFWLEMGKEEAAGSLEPGSGPVELPAGVVRVVLFSFDGHIEIFEGRDAGQLLLHQDGRVEVRSAPEGTPRVGSRLLFPIRTPRLPGRYRMRCHLYHRQTLLQSRLVEAHVAEGAPVRAAALAVQVDYSAGTALEPRRLHELEPLTLSVFVNDDGDGTHAFRFWGEGDVKAQAVLGEGALQNHIDNVRDALREAAWGSTTSEESDLPFRYDGKGRPVDFAEDLIRLACHGYRLWVAIGGEFAETGLPPAGAASPVKRLAALLRRPGTIEIATKVSSSMVVPAALFYDHPLDSGLPGLRLCTAALEALRAGDDPGGIPCLRGQCPWYDDRSVVCPGGFWGYRHAIGLPQSTAPALGETSPVPAPGPPFIPYTGRPRCVIGVASDLEGRHTREMQSRYRGSLHRDRSALLDELRDGTAPQLIYFYCHGDLDRGIPVLRIGGALSPPIAYEQIAGDMFWPDSRPLVFLNGCRTAAVEPRYAMTFVDAFVRRARASGLIGTEIITYESLAAEFAESVLEHFLGEGQQVTIAQAMRSARLGLLSRGNPLGLIYVAYTPPNLRMKQG